ncbi:hypothetical protein HPP92_028981 [Vanilla planifolia]|uniref:Uncharacterized protein n=1 Tax=Vanilla planifolia TaxID=51239 RepID=A0A835P5M6_VANPL|nr:hypothetical protein HPP92_028981 [Vanilla planifolia]KAG0446159.1 hypothetical protein HPP92_028970 [Vanilla planifolia]
MSNSASRPQVPDHSGKVEETLGSTSASLGQCAYPNHRKKIDQADASVVVPMLKYHRRAVQPAPSIGYFTGERRQTDYVAKTLPPKRNCRRY